MTTLAMIDQEEPSAVDDGPAAERAAFPTADVARVEVVDLDRSILPWRELAAHANASPYQNPDWVVAWSRSIGALRGIRPAVVLAFDSQGKPIALLPLGVKRRFALRFATFLGGRESNANMGLFDRRLTWPAATIRRLVDAAAFRAQIDVFVFRNQPHARNGWKNPLASLRHQPSPSGVRWATLTVGPGRGSVHHPSKHARKLLRQKRTKLELHGPVTHHIATTPAEASACVDAYLAHKAARPETSAARRPGEAEALRRFLLAASDPRPSQDAPFELHTLMCGDDIIATLGATAFAGRLSGMFISFDPRPDLARFSPGDQLVAEVLGRLDGRGIDSFDLGIGEARYKATFCPKIEPLFDTCLGITPVGKAAASLLAAGTAAKGWTKRSSWAWPIVQAVRKHLARRSPS